MAGQHWRGWARPTQELGALPRFPTCVAGPSCTTHPKSCGANGEQNRQDTNWCPSVLYWYMWNLSTDTNTLKIINEKGFRRKKVALHQIYAYYAYNAFISVIPFLQDSVSNITANQADWNLCMQLVTGWDWSLCWVLHHSPSVSRKASPSNWNLVWESPRQSRSSLTTLY